MRIRHQHYHPPRIVGYAQNCDPVPDLFAQTPRGGEWVIAPEPTYTGALDGDRLTTLLARVIAALGPHDWLTLGELKARCGGSEAGISARIREARTRAGGSHVIERRRRGNPKAGLWEYRRVK